MTSIDLCNLATVCGGQFAPGLSTSSAELAAACAEGRANPPAGSTPDQACLAKVWEKGALQGVRAGADAVVNRLMTPAKP